MIERVARAICDAEDPLSGDPIAVVIHCSEHLFTDGKTVEQQLADVMTICRVAARAAIEAMREPLCNPVQLADKLKAIDEETMYQEPASTKELIDRAADLIEQLATRLEIPAPPFEAYDGIACRDETIKLLDKKVEAEKARATAAEAERDKMREAAIRAALCLSGFIGEGIGVEGFEAPEDAWCRIVDALGLPDADDNDLRAALKDLSTQPGSGEEA